MALTTRDALRQQLRTGDIAPVYVLFGAEKHLRDLAADTIANKSFTAEDLRDFNETTFSLNTEDNLARALAAAEQLPMMSKRRVVRVHDVRISATGYRDTITEEHEPLLSAYFANPAPHSTVIFVADDLNGVRKIGKLLREKTRAVTFDPLDDKELTEWARGSFAKLGASIDEMVLRLFISRIGPDLERLTNEINKLTTAVLPDKVITADLIETLVPASREVSNFELGDHLVAGRVGEAFKALERSLDEGAEPVVLIGSLSYAYRRLLAAKDMMDRGSDRREVVNVVRLRYTDQEPFLAAARKADTRKLVAAIKAIAETDLAIKTSAGGGGPAAARTQMEVLACRLARLSSN